MENFKLKNVLGMGYSGEVIEVIDKNGQSFALKKFPNINSYQIKKYKDEVKIHSQLNHENIVKFIKSFENMSDSFILMEKCEQNLQEILLEMKANAEIMEITEALKIFDNLCAAVFYIHQEGIVHRDIKPENILKKGKIWKLCDFGFSSVSTKRFNKIKGTPEFISPEAIIKSGTSETYEGMPTDIWAMGISLYEILYLKNPFFDTETCKIYRKIRNGNFTFAGRDIGKDLRLLIRSMLTADPDNRIVIEVLYVNFIALMLKKMK
jgi:serine/threonine protein kinase